MTVVCNLCGQAWDRDPALEVECPTCQAKVGQKCTRPSGHGCDIHATRDRLAMKEGFMEPCPAGPSATGQMSLFGGDYV